MSQNTKFFNLRLPASLDAQIRRESESEGLSINSTIVMHLAKSLALTESSVAKVRKSKSPKNDK